MLGAIIGDVAGSQYEFNAWAGSWKDIPLLTDGCFFTDDTVLTFAVAAALMQNNDDVERFGAILVDELHHFGRLYPKAGYGGRFAGWLRRREREPYNSFGNGSAMRVSPVAWAFDSLAEVEAFAAASAAVTHNHSEGIKGASATAGSIFLARMGAGKEEIRAYVRDNYNYDLDRTLEQIRPDYAFYETCQQSVPEAIIAFLESDSFEDCLKKAIWLRGDADTQAAIAGSIGEAFFGIPEGVKEAALPYLDDFLRGQLNHWRAWLKDRPVLQ